MNNEYYQNLINNFTTEILRITNRFISEEKKRILIKLSIAQYTMNLKELLTESINESKLKK